MSYLYHIDFAFLTFLRSFVLIVDIIICIDPITSYLARNVYPIFQIYSSSVSHVLSVPLLRANFLRSSFLNISARSFLLSCT